MPRRNLKVNDVVIVKEDLLPRNKWQLGRIMETTLDSDGVVRRAKHARWREGFRKVACQTEAHNRGEASSEVRASPRKRNIEIECTSTYLNRHLHLALHINDTFYLSICTA